MDMKEIFHAFAAEAEELLGQVEHHLLAVEQGRNVREAFEAMFRAIHTLKGNSQVLGFEALAAFVHRYEDALVAFREGRASPTSENISVMLRSIDVMRAKTNRAVLGHPEVAAADAPWGEALLRIASADIGNLAASLTAAETTADPAFEETPVAEFLRVPIEKLDRMVDLIGEIAIGRGRIRQLLHDLAGGDGLAAVEKDMDHLYDELQEVAMQVRMVALGPIFQQFVRVGRDTANAVGKDARLEIRGHEVELDARVIGQLRGGLTHLIRNAIVHGLESKEQRLAAGKQAQGVIQLSARHEAGGVVIEITDDGRGFDLERIRARAFELHGEAAERYSVQELMKVTFSPGFSTAETVTSLAGRGVGLDVVNRQVEVLHGRLEVDSQPGRGTRFTIRLPLTLSIIDGFAVTASGETYIVPMDCVVECMSLPEHLRSEETTGHFELHGSPVPFVRIGKLFQLPAPPSLRESVLIVNTGNGMFGLTVDALNGEIQTVIKPLHGVQGANAITGSAILGNGRVALIVDVKAIHDQVHVLLPQ